MTNIWVCGKVTYNEDESQDWEIIGIFDSEPRAVTACTTIYHFVGLMTMNEILPEETIDWPGLYYPLDKAKEETH